MHDDRPVAGATGHIPQQVLDALWKELYGRVGLLWGEVSSESMAPFLHAGDRVLVEHIPPEQLRFGDIGIFEADGSLVAHRLLGRVWAEGQLFFREKGDANPCFSTIPARRVLGRARVLGRKGLEFDLTHRRGRILQIVLGGYAVAWLGLQHVMRVLWKLGDTEPPQALRNLGWGLHMLGLTLLVSMFRRG
jgi:signal peptidase I